MTYTSAIAPTEIIIDDSNFRQFVADQFIAGEKMTRGLEPHPDPDGQFCSEPFTTPFSLPLIPRSEWADRIQEMEQTKSRLTDLGKQHGITVKSQDGIGYCWAFGTVTACEYARARMGLPHVELSATSVAGPIKNYADRGGWGKEAFDYIVPKGIAPTSMWPEVPTGRNPRYDTPESQAERQKFRFTEWFEIRRGDFDALMTALLNRMPAAIGLNWWGHLVCALDPVALPGGGFGVRIQNSWGTNWSEGGFGILTQSKATPDDITVVPRVSVVPQAA